MTTGPIAESVNGHQKNTLTTAITIMMMLTMTRTAVQLAALHSMPHLSQLRHLSSETFNGFSQSFQGKYQVRSQPLPNKFYVHGTVHP